jgi:hypothetical protein
MKAASFGLVSLMGTSVATVPQGRTIDQQLRAWRSTLWYVVDLRREAGDQLGRGLERQHEACVENLRRAFVAFDAHKKALESWAKTYDQLDKVLDAVDEFKEVKAWDDRGKTLLNFVKKPLDTLWDESKEKMADAYKSTLTGDRDKWDVIKAGIRNLGNYYATIDHVSRGYKSPGDILRKLDKSADDIQRLIEEDKRTLSAYPLARKLRRAGNRPLSKVRI